MPLRKVSLGQPRHEGAWVKEQKVIVKNGMIAEYRVDLKVTFILID
jgi:flavin-binding protein dodecin